MGRQRRPVAHAEGRVDVLAYGGDHARDQKSPKRMIHLRSLRTVHCLGRPVLGDRGSQRNRSRLADSRMATTAGCFSFLSTEMA